MSKKIPSQDLRYANLLADPTCRKCGETKTIGDFPRRAVDYACTKCRGEYAKEAYRKKVAEASKAELAEYRAKVCERQNRKRREKLEAMTPVDRERYMAEINEGNKRRRDAVRHEVYQAYGGYRCACCGETERAFLSINHVNNDGAAHKREFNLRTGEQMYRWLKRNGFPQGFQILCMNCQCGKRNNGGLCPHQVRCNDYPVRE